jgi:hypothetical protein
MSKTRRWLVLATVSAGLLMVSVDTTVLYTAPAQAAGSIDQARAAAGHLPGRADHLAARPRAVTAGWLRSRRAGRHR